ncbi:MAG: C4-dicarboxylate TRAP transporter substrate-binding protein [Deltaproteobacteria bacterium]|nr:C4-dicarboxylate TRAP transporter substrate-binding protein [Deltaproteobacteria bacterium]
MFRKPYWMVVVVGIMLLAILPVAAWAEKPETAKPIVLKASIQSPAGVPFTQELYWWLDEVEKRSAGRIKFERYPGESLAKAAEQVDALESGMADVALFVPTYTPGKLPLNTIIALPFSLQYGWVNATSYRQLVHQVSEVKAEFTKHNIRVVSSYATGPYYVFSTKPIREFGDFKGKKIIGTGPIAALLKAIGAAPLGIVITESYEALQRGTADGAVYGPSAAGTYHMEEVCKYLLKLPLGGVCGPIGMNINTWNKLPADIQKMIDALPPEHAKAVHKIYQIDGDGKYMEIFKKAGVESMEPSAELMSEVRKIAKDVVWGKWAQDQEARKLPGKKVLQSYLNLLEKNTPLNPFK